MEKFAPAHGLKGAVDTGDATAEAAAQAVQLAWGVNTAAGKDFISYDRHCDLLGRRSTLRLANAGNGTMLGVFDAPTLLPGRRPPRRRPFYWATPVCVP